jgi:hypothetical protein
MVLERVYQGIPISIMGYHWIPLSGWDLNIRIMVGFGEISPRSHAEPLCRWSAMSAGPRLMLRRLGDTKRWILPWKNWAFPSQVDTTGHILFSEAYTWYILLKPPQKNAPVTSIQRRPELAGHRLCVVPWIRPTLRSVELRWSGWGWADLWKNSLWKPSILAAMVIGDGSWHWLWFTWLYHKNRGIL